MLQESREESKQSQPSRDFLIHWAHDAALIGWTLTEKTIWEVEFKYTLGMIWLYFRSLKSNRSVL